MLEKREGFMGLLQGLEVEAIYEPLAVVALAKFL
jgi:hypothetical protein